MEPKTESYANYLEMCLRRVNADDTISRFLLAGKIKQIRRYLKTKKPAPE